MLDPILYITNILIITTLICLKNYGYYKIKKKENFNNFIYFGHFIYF